MPLPPLLHLLSRNGHLCLRCLRTWKRINIKVHRHWVGREFWINLNSWMRREQLDPTTQECFLRAELGRLEDPGPNSVGLRAGRVVGRSILSGQGEHTLWLSW